MKVTLGINTGFATNRFPEPDDWIGIVADELALDTVQFTADLLNPFLPEDELAREVEKIRGLCAKKGVRIQTTFTSAFTRVNPRVRNHEPRPGGCRTAFRSRSTPASRYSPIGLSVGAEPIADYPMVLQSW
jgi:hypothetical protein